MKTSTALAHRQTLSLAFVALLAWPALNFAAQPVTSMLEASLTADRSELTAGSPLLLRLSMRNAGTEELPLSQPFGEQFGSALVQIKAPGDDRFRDFRPRGYGLLQLVDYRGPLAPGDSVATHALVLCDREGNPVFSRPGRYEMRAAGGTGSLSATSAPVTVEVKAALPAAQGRLEALKTDLAGLSLYQALEPARLSRLRDGLADHAEFTDAVRLAEAIAGIRDRDAGRKRAAARRLEDIRQAGRPVWKDLATEMLAKHEARSGDKETARRLLKELPHRSYETEATLRTLADDRR